MTKHALRLNGVFTLALCLVTALAHAEVLELEGTIKSVDATKREIAIGRKVLDVAELMMVNERSQPKSEPASDKARRLLDEIEALTGEELAEFERQKASRRRRRG